MRYTVKWEQNGQVKYGICTGTPKDGIQTVEDAILPIGYNVKETDLEEISFEMGRFDLKQNKFVNQKGV